jgi:hypothetical protein
MIKHNEIFVQVLKQGKQGPMMTPPPKPLPDTDKPGKPLDD